MNANEDLIIKTETGGRHILIYPDGGNVGIGQGNPPEKLSVTGNISASGALIVSSSAIGPPGTVTSSAHLTVEGAISSSGDIYTEGDIYLLEDKDLYAPTAGGAIRPFLGLNSGVITIGNTQFESILANEPLFVNGEISASGGIHGGTTGTQTTGSYDFPGAIMGYTAIGQNAAAASYNVTNAFAVPKADHHVVFVARKSGNVEIDVQAFMDASNTRTLYYALSDEVTYSSVDGDDMHEQEVAMFDETDEGMVRNKWLVSGLTPGTTYKYWFALKCSHNSVYVMRWGGNSILGFPAFIMKATALPSNIYTG